MLPLRHLCVLAALSAAAAAYVPYAFPNLKKQLATTRTHVRITYSALCISIYEWLSDRPDLQNLAKPEPHPDFAPLVRKCPLKKWPIHYNKNWDSFKAKLETAIDKVLEKINIDLDDLENRFQPFRIIEKYAGYVDLDSATKSDPRYHFDAEKIREGNQLIIDKRRNITDALKHVRKETSARKLEDIRKELGYLLHTLQDFYSHSNWIELGRSDVVKNLAKDQNWPIKLAGPNDATCRDCATKLTGEQRAEFNKVGVELGEAFGLHDAPPEDIRLCPDNVIVNSPPMLTTGYTDSEPKVAGKGKCSHGGVIDKLSTERKPLGGINKDADYFLYASHHQLHNKSAVVAHEATLVFLRELRRDVNDTQFGILLGLLRSPAGAVRAGIGAVCLAIGVIVANAQRAL